MPFTELVLETCDLQCERNGREHRTAEMGSQQLVVRRGQPFTITLNFTGRGYEEGVDKLAFNVETGECHSSHPRAELRVPSASVHSQGATEAGLRPEAVCRAAWLCHASLHGQQGAGVGTGTTAS